MRHMSITSGFSLIELICAKLPYIFVHVSSGSMSSCGRAGPADSVGDGDD